MTRELAIGILEMSKHMATSGRLYNQAIDMAIEALSERPHGKWVFSTSIPIGGGRESAGYKCSVCGRGEFSHVDKFEFCPFCGADMRGEKK